MSNFIQKLKNSNLFHINIIFSIIFILSFITFLIIIRYNVEGETNLPFILSKISIISSSQGVNKDSTDTRWAFDVSQNNDIFIEFTKNNKYKKENYINSISIDNITTKSIKNENVKLFKPDSDSTQLIFTNNQNNICTSLNYISKEKNNLNTMTISPEGGTIAFRCSNTNVAEYKSNDEVINHNELLQKCNIKSSDLNINLNFDLTLNLQNKNSYRSNITLDLPIGDVINNGTTSIELTDLNKFIFKKVNIK